MIQKIQIVFSLLLAITAASNAHAAMCITIDGSTNDVVVTASGSLDVTGASVYVANPNPGSYSPGIIPSGTSWYIAPGSGGAHDSYFLTTVDPNPFGTSTVFNAPSSSSGDSFFLFGAGFVTENVGVNAGYVSGSPIFSQMTFSNTSLAALTLIEGTYNYALPNDTIKLSIFVPEPPPSLCGFGLLCLAALSRLREPKLGGRARLCPR